ncbi:fatty acid hydroxylase family protein [Bacteriovorax sp. BAL6_X]|uniref:sterol desaturase family protein n=1 Tax=Bacteriovorax sp. BAL6_X TaxID=1201290 RepID=UPI0003869C58|nr:sterol desaturase family protein [Bacteriovorax sp. BAL6_X]EPZ49934.1 fatty acid hydroxylase family protein [Bacteriovorax sp. BAL6_X]
MINLQDYINEIWQFERASSRLFLPFLLSSILVICIWNLKNGRSFKVSFLNTIKDSSFHTDLGLFLFNSLLKITVFASVAGLSIEIAWYLQVFFLKYFPYLRSSIEVSTFSIVLFSALAFAFDDFIRFGVHLVMHRVPFLWKLHRTHHTATSLNPLTLYRAHPLEVLIATFRNALSGGIVTAIGAFLFGSLDIFYTALGVNIFGLIFNSAFSNLRHSSVPIRFGIFEKAFISPYMHQIHHSSNPKHFNKNYGTCFTFWDKIAGSLYSPKKSEELKFGAD